MSYFASAYNRFKYREALRYRRQVIRELTEALIEYCCVFKIPHPQRLTRQSYE